MFINLLRLYKLNFKFCLLINLPQPNLIVTDRLVYIWMYLLQVTAELNPGCIYSQCKDVTFVHVKAVGQNDTLHHLWDFTGKPSLFLALTDRNASLSISWTPFILGSEGAVSFDIPPKYVYGVVFDKVRVSSLTFQPVSKLIYHWLRCSCIDLIKLDKIVMLGFE